ncbi:MAG: hypothetical protein EBU52_18490, partial [Cytophagia bacterium]|nr:hypothetical protein [Cytophagia bacterium]
MQTPYKTFLSKSGQLGFSIFRDPAYMVGIYKNLTNVSTEEYLDYVESVGDALSELRAGRVLLDFSEMKGFSISLRAAAVNNINSLVIEKAPYFVLAIIKSKNLFENLATQTALKMAMPLSKKFLAG